MNTKTLRACLILAVLAFAAAPLHANTATANNVKWTYTVSNGKATISGAYLLISTNSITIPSSLDNYPVRAIDKDTFNGFTSLKNIVIPNTVNSIGNRAFQGSGLTSLTLPESVTDFGISVFSDCSSLTSVNIKSNTKKIGQAMFSGCSKLVSVSIPNTVTNISYRAFENCTRLKSIVIPGNVSIIAQSAFSGCTALRNLSLPGCFRISEIFPSSCSLITDVTICNGTTRVESFAFGGCSMLKSITIPDDVTSIGSGAFEDCANLDSVNIEDLQAWCRIMFEDNDANPCRCGAKLLMNGEDVTELAAYGGNIPPIARVSITRRDPWNGKAYIAFSILKNFNKALVNGESAVIRVTATDCISGISYTAEKLEGDIYCTPGAHSIVWDMQAQGVSFELSHAVFSLSVVRGPAQYCVISFSGGTDSPSHHVKWLAGPPDGGFNTQTYKTTSLVLRRIEPGTFMMCNRYRTTLTKPYYIGIFEVTRSQYQHALGSSSTDMRPKNKVNVVGLRGSAGISSASILSGSFMHSIRTGTGLPLDLPTEAQWEYASRAGTTSKYNNGGNSLNDLDLLGRNYHNMQDGKGGYSAIYKGITYIGSYRLENWEDGETTVGSYLPNAWGLYDMHGNLAEICLDWLGDLSSPQVDPTGPSSGSFKVLRGGSWLQESDFVSPLTGENLDYFSNSMRSSATPDGSHTQGELDGVPVLGNDDSAHGFRLAFTLPDNTATTQMVYQIEGILPETFNLSIYTVKFNANGGSGTMSDEMFVCGTPKALSANTFTRTGYAFAGWAKSATGSKVYDDEQSVSDLTTTSGGTVNLYAVWTGKPYTITFDHQGGSAGTASVTATYGAALPSITVPTRAGYTFGGYFAAKNGGGTQYYTASGASARNWDKTAATTLYATWTAKSYTVTFDRQGGSGGSSSATAVYGSAMPSITVPTRTGYSFGGYYTAKNGGGMQYYTASGASARNWDKTSATTLYAKWTAKTYTLTFDANGGTHSSSVQTATATYGGVLPNCVPAPTNDDWAFSGWASDQAGTSLWYGPDGTKLLPAYTTAADTTLYAVWKPATPVIVPADGTILSGSQSVVISCATAGAAIHFTTNGAMPTAESPAYRRFRVSQRMTVKAVAVKNGVCSAIAVAEFALGRCADPVITPSDGTAFWHSGLSVTIAWAGEDGVLRYTLDGSEPTKTSPVYDGPFTIDETTVVKTRAFGDQFFDSAVVTATLTRGWRTVATPVIRAAASFTGSRTPVEIDCATPGATIRYTTDGSTPDSRSPRYAGRFHVADSCTVKAYAALEDYDDSAVASFAIERIRGIGDTMGDPDRTFATGGNLPFFRVADSTASSGESMKSGAIAHNGTSTLSTTVDGPGTFSFRWKTSCEDSEGYYDWDRAEFRVDGALAAQLDGQTDWRTFSQAVSGAGPHAMEWRYVKDDMGSEGQDCCWVADFSWAPSCTETTEVPVPHGWLLGFYPDTPDKRDSYEAVAKSSAANGKNKVWECYLAGTSPTDPADRFLAEIVMDENGNPRVTWTPDLGGARDYAVEGKPSLAGEWGVPDADSRFFRVHVAMPGRFGQQTITFDSAGGTSVAPITAAYGSSLVSPMAPTKNGYNFAGWSPAFPATMPAGGAILTAQWTANTYSVKFNANGGSGSMSNESFVYGTAKALTANAFTRSGYTFAGWATSATGAKVYNDKQSISNLTTTNGGTVNLYAVWTGVPYSVQFNANGGSGTMANESFVYGTAKALTANAFTRTSYTFAGWATSATGAKVYNDKQSVQNLTTTSGGTVNLYAVWTQATYSVKFNANGGSGTMADETFVYGQAKALTANAFTRTGYMFAGWSTSATGAKVYDDQQSVSNLTTINGGTVNLYAVWNPATYCVIDLSAGSSASSYPITFLAAPPSGGFNTDVYKTTKLVLKRIEAGNFKMQGATTVTLTKPFFIGLFEVTQKQYQLVTGRNPSNFSGDKLPVETVSYDEIRGSSNGSQWPSSSAVDSTSFLGRLRTRTGLDFDLPTEAQWEYACRAGTATTYSYGDSASGNYMWYADNSSGTTHAVGTKQPNPWGLYDMHGNVMEWCLDWYGSTLSYGADPKGPTSGTYRVYRGGTWGSPARVCTSSYRLNARPSLSTSYDGFRLACILPN